MAKINPLTIVNAKSVEELVRWGSIFFESIASIFDGKISISENIKSQVFNGVGEGVVANIYGKSMLAIRHDLKSVPVLVLNLVDVPANGDGIFGEDITQELNQQNFWDANYVYVRSSLAGKKPYFILVA